MNDRAADRRLTSLTPRMRWRTTPVSAMCVTSATLHSNGLAGVHQYFEYRYSRVQYSLEYYSTSTTTSTVVREHRVLATTVVVSTTVHVVPVLVLRYREMTRTRTLEYPSVGNSKPLDSTEWYRQVVTATTSTVHVLRSKSSRAEELFDLPIHLPKSS